MDNNSKTRHENFVVHVLERARQDSGFGARMRRADNPGTEYQSWGILASFGVNLERDNERLPFALVGAAICNADIEKDGNYGIGSALAGAFESAESDSSDKPAEARLRRLLACASTAEACRILRPILRLVNAKTKRPLCHATLLRDLLYFDSAGQENIKKRWARDFYGNHPDQVQDKTGEPA